jgi:hypothetical protein
MVTISYDEKPGIQALAVTTPDRPPVGQHPSHLRDYEYERLGTVSLLAGLDLHSGRIIETVSDTHASVVQPAPANVKTLNGGSFKTKINCARPLKLSSENTTSTPNLSAGGNARSGAVNFTIQL